MGHVSFAARAVRGIGGFVEGCAVGCARVAARRAEKGSRRAGRRAESIVVVLARKDGLVGDVG